MTKKQDLKSKDRDFDILKYENSNYQHQVQNNYLFKNVNE